MMEKTAIVCVNVYVYQYNPKIYQFLDVFIKISGKSINFIKLKDLPTLKAFSENENKHINSPGHSSKHGRLLTTNEI